MALISIPDPDEFEVSLFGPGIGESIVLHVGAGEWIIVDSCRGNRGAAAVEYLVEIGVAITTSVKLIVATHWHNDHVRGLSDIVQRCHGAEFLCSPALFHAEFLALAELWDELEHSRSAVSELYRVIKHFERLGHAA